MLQLILCMLEGVEGGWGLGWGEATGWMPLPTHPQRYRDPASLAYWLDLDSYMQRLYQTREKLSHRTRPDTRQSSRGRLGRSSNVKTA